MCRNTLSAIILTVCTFSCAPNSHDHGVARSPDEAVNSYYESWQRQDSVRLSTVLQAKDTLKLQGKYYSLFSHNPTQIRLLKITKNEQAGDSLAFVDALIELPEGRGSDTEKFMLGLDNGWRVIATFSMWHQLDRH